MHHNYKMDKGPFGNYQKYFLPAFICWVLITGFASLAPAESFGETDFQLPHLDKVVHFLMYFILAILACGAAMSQPGFKNSDGPRMVTIYTWTALLAFLYGSFLEIMQELMDMGRHFDIWDIIANIAGTFVGIFIFAKAIKK